jgi:hypothetical protein
VADTDSRAGSKSSLNTSTLFRTMLIGIPLQHCAHAAGSSHSPASQGSTPRAVAYPLGFDSIVGQIFDRLMYCDHIERDGEGLFQRACENDREGVVARRNCDP